jgi:NADPH:quinone reductase-like Zn-dependent oxidoreductase
LCKKLGADEVIDYHNNDVASLLSESENQYDFVLDNIGNNFALYWKSPKFTKTGAKYVQIGSEANMASMYDLAYRFLVPQSLGGGKRPFSFGMTSTNYEHFTELAQMVVEGKLKPVIDEVFAFEDAPKAYKKLKTGRAKGKIVVQVNSSHG